jgi:PAB-dependent poly(A)-specific ribonuclease subunit 3
VAAAALQQPAPSPPPAALSSLSKHAGAKEWVPAAAAPAQPSLSPPSSPPARAASTGSLKLNPNKTPFKPSSIGGGAAPLADGAAIVRPASRLNQQVAEFVPAGGDTSEESMHFEPYEAQASDEQTEDAQYVDAQNPYAVQTSPFAGVGGLSSPTSYVPPSAYTSYSEFASTSLPVGGATGRPAIPASSSSMQSLSQHGSDDRSSGGGQFIDESLRARLALQSHLQVARLQPDDPRFATLPTSLDHDRYHSLLPIQPDEVPAGLQQWYGSTGGGSASYKVISAMDGRSYVIKRLLACRINEEAGRRAIASWIEFASRHGSGSAPQSVLHSSASRSWGAGPVHPSIIAVRGAFFTKDFGPVGNVAGTALGSLCLVYDYHSTAAALLPATQDVSMPVDALWHYAIQLLGAVAALHSAGLSAATNGLLRPGRVLLTSDQRIHLNCCGVYECSTGHAHPSDAEVAKSQAEDFRSLGLLLLGWMGFTTQATQMHTLLSTPKPASAAAAALSSFTHQFEQLKPELERQFPNDLFSFVTLLLTGSDVTAAQLQSSIAPRLHAELTAQLSQTDYIEGELAKEAANGRLMRLLIKLGFVSDRPESVTRN